MPVVLSQARLPITGAPAGFRNTPAAVANFVLRAKGLRLGALSDIMNQLP